MRLSLSAYELTRVVLDVAILIALIGGVAEASTAIGILRSCIILGARFIWKFLRSCWI